MQRTKEKQIRLFPVYLTLLLSYIGFGVVIPILPLLFLDPNGIHLPADTPYYMRTFLLGLFLAIYPLAQIIGGPLWGIFSDHHGRKKTMIIMLSGGAIAYVISAIAIDIHNLALLFFARFCIGFLECVGNVAKAAIGDVSTEQTKVKNFSNIAFIYSAGFIFGPLIGGEISSEKLVSWFNFSTPFWFLAIISIVCIFTLFGFKETLKRKMNDTITLKIFSTLDNLKKILESEKLRLLFGWLFLYYLGWSFFTQTFQIYLYEKFHVNHTQIGLIYSYMGLLMLISQICFARPLGKYFKPISLLYVMIMLFVPALLIILIPETVGGLYYLLPFTVIIQGIIQTNASAIISASADMQHQGEIQGHASASNSAAFLISPVVGGLLIPYHAPLPITLGAFMVLLSWLVYRTFFKKCRLA